jgi:hypothetical protein
MVRWHSPRSLSRNCQVGDPFPRTAFRAYRLPSSHEERFPDDFQGASWAHALANAMLCTICLESHAKRGRLSVRSSPGGIQKNKKIRK